MIISIMYSALTICQALRLFCFSWLYCFTFVFFLCFKSLAILLSLSPTHSLSQYFHHATPPPRLVRAFCLLPTALILLLVSLFLINHMYRVWFLTLVVHMAQEEAPKFIHVAQGPRAGVIHKAFRVHRGLWISTLTHCWVLRYSLFLEFSDFL